MKAFASSRRILNGVPRGIGWSKIWRRWLMVFLLFQPGALLFFFWRFRGPRPLTAEALKSLILDTAINDLGWGLVLFPLLAVLLRFPPVKRGLLISVAIGILTAPVWIYLHTVLYLILYASFGPVMDPPLGSIAGAWHWLTQLNPLWRALHLCIILLIHYCCDFHSLYLEKARGAAELQAELATARLHALQMQLQPHFLFNTLHAIHVLVRADQDACCKMIEQLSRMLRLTLERSEIPEVSLQEELGSLEPYLEIEQTRFQDRLTIEREIATDALGALVPNLILQPLVENAVKHGISRKPGPGLIRIRAGVRDEMLVLEVLDDGPGWRGEANSPGIGLTNLRNRLHCLYGGGQRLTVLDQEPEGTGVRVEIPLRLAAPAR
jgi:two-component system LytT family sensor kinase